MSHRGKFLNEVMRHMHQILVFLHVLLESAAFLFLQQIEVIGGVEQGLDEALPGAERWDLGSHRRAHPRADHQDKLGGALGLQAGEQLPEEQAEIERPRFLPQ